MITNHKLPIKPITLVMALAFSQVVSAQDSNVSNEDIAKAYADSNPNAQVPTLNTQADGTTTIEWHGGVGFNTYHHQIDTDNAFGTANQEGSFQQLDIQSDLRATNQKGDVNYFQLSATATDDKTKLSQFGRQLNMIQIGRAGQGYLLSAGDIAPNFSSLSSNLGVRGLLAQRQVGQVGLSAYAGVVAPSWEYIERRVPRAQLMKEVVGAKADYALNNDWRLFATALRSRDKLNSTDVAAGAANSAENGTLGLQYAKDAFKLNAEMAKSHFKQQDSKGLTGGAGIVDASYQGQNYALMAGYHNLTADYASLSTNARPGTRERYMNGTWTAASWLGLAADLRNSKEITLASDAQPSLTTNRDSVALNANINFGAAHPNWGAVLGQTISVITDPTGSQSQNQSFTSGLNYASSTWFSNVAYKLDKQLFEEPLAADSSTDTYSLTVGRDMNNADALTQATWTVRPSYSANYANQQLSTGLDTQQFNQLFAISGQHTRWGVVNIGYGNGFIARTLGQSTLRRSSVTVDASHTLNQYLNVKLYLTSERINQNDDALYAKTETFGLQAICQF